LDFTAFEELIGKINGVKQVKIVPENDTIKELHIIAGNLRSPKQIVRDIESSLLAAYNYRIDRKVISIAQIDTVDYKEIKRIKLGGISMNSCGNEIEFTVKLENEDEEYDGSQKGIKTSSGKKKVVAQATCKAVEKVIGQAPLFDVQDVVINTCKEITYVTVVINLIENENEEILIGSAIVRNDVNEAIAKAALDAINRKIQKVRA
jgi:hypothetical protein